MRSLRSENKDATKLRSLEHWADIEVRSAVRCAATRRIVRAGPIDRTWPMTTPGGDEADRAAMSASVHRTGEWWRRASGNSGALSKPAGWLRRKARLSISHETIYRHIWRDRKRGGRLYLHLRCSPKQRRKRYGSYDSRGRLAGKRPISERPAGAQNRSRVGHLEADTVIGTSSDKHCVLTFVDRKTGYVMIGKLEARTVEATNRRAVRLIKTAARPTHTITADNGTEFHGYGAIEAETGSKFYFAAPYHSWERGTSENTNGLIRQYLPKRMAHITQHACNRIAHKLNNRPRKRLGFLTPKDCYELNSTT